MKSFPPFLVALLLSVGCFSSLVVAADPGQRADSTQTLTASSSAADVEAAATQISKGISKPVGADSPYLAQFAAVDHKVLISVSAKFDPQSTRAKG